MSVAVKTMTDKTILCGPLYPCSTVARLMTLFCEKEGVHADHIKLLYAGRRLEDDCTLESYGINNQTVVHMGLRLRAD